jgi:hypothetical protein
MWAVDRTPRPTLLVYVANHGEDAWGSMRGDGVARSPRVADVPLVVYANAAFARRRPEVIANARRHRDEVVLTPWLHDALLDVFRVTTANGAPAFDARRSIFGNGFNARSDSGSLALVRAVGLLPPFVSRDSGAGATLCAHRSNSLFKYLEGRSEYACAEMDIVLDPRDGPAFIHHPPVRSSGLPLFDLLARAGVPARGLWLDVKNLDEHNAPALLTHLSALVPAAARRRVLVETSNDGLARSPIARAFGDSGFVLSYYLPTDLGCACSRDGDVTCGPETERLVRLLDGAAFRGVSFDARGRRLARAINGRLGSRLVFNAWTPMDRCANGDQPAPLEQAALDSLLGETQKYLVRMPSSFTH